MDLTPRAGFFCAFSLGCLVVVAALQDDAPPPSITYSPGFRTSGPPRSWGSNRRRSGLRRPTWKRRRGSARLPISLGRSHRQHAPHHQEVSEKAIDSTDACASMHARTHSHSQIADEGCWTGDGTVASVAGTSTVARSSVVTQLHVPRPRSACIRPAAMHACASRSVVLGETACSWLQ
jgi:hypothetical protein